MTKKITKLETGYRPPADKRHDDLKKAKTAVDTALPLIDPCLRHIVDIYKSLKELDNIIHKLRNFQNDIESTAKEKTKCSVTGV